MTPLERTVLLHLLRIRQALEPDALDYEYQATILERGYSQHYNEVWLVQDDPISDEDRKFVFDVLDMFEAIGWFIQDTDDAEVRGHTWSQFDGFSSQDGALAGYAYFILSHRYPSLQNATWHVPPVPLRPVYAAMLAAWNGIKRDRLAHRPSKDEVMAVLTAADSHCEATRE